MKSGTILFPSSFANIKDGRRAHSTTITYEIITSLEEAKLIMLPVFSLPSAYKLCNYLVCFNCVFLSPSNTKPPSSSPQPPKYSNWVWRRMEAATNEKL